MLARHQACYLRVSESGQRTLKPSLFANAYLQFLFDHVDFALLTATSRRSIARRDAPLASHPTVGLQQNVPELFT